MLDRIVRHFQQWIQRAMKSDELAALDARINALLPPVYHGCYSRVSPTSMGSAHLRYGPDGKPAWDEIWTTFCDLALAGGPPHRGKLLEPAPSESIGAQPVQYRAVLEEIVRAVGLTAGLPHIENTLPGWVGFRCPKETMAAWLQFAIVAENISCLRREHVLLLPAGPEFRVEKEIKNVTVAVAKACHYWEGHLSGDQRAAASKTAWEPAASLHAEYQTVANEVTSRLRDVVQRPVILGYLGWAGFEVGSEDAAVWMLRAVVSHGVLARRENSILYVPIGAQYDVEQIERVVDGVSLAWRLYNQG